MADTVESPGAGDYSPSRRRPARTASAGQGIPPGRRAPGANGQAAAEVLGLTSR